MKALYDRVCPLGFAFWFLWWNWALLGLHWGKPLDKDPGCLPSQRASLTWGSHMRAQMRPEERSPPSAFWSQPQAQAEGILVILTGTNLPWMGSNEGVSSQTSGVKWLHLVCLVLFSFIYLLYIYSPKHLALNREVSVLVENSWLRVGIGYGSSLFLSISNPQPAVLLLMEDWAKRGPDHWIAT